MGRELKHIFVEEGSLKRDIPLITLKDPALYQYLVKVLRFQEGEEVLLLDGTLSAFVRLKNIQHREKSLEFDVKNILSVPTEPFRIFLYTGLPKGDTADNIIDLATQLGAAKIIFFESAFTQVKQRDVNEGKLQRWRKKAAQAAQQSQRMHLPDIPRPLLLEDILRSMDSEAVNILFYEEAEEYCYSEPLKQSPHNINVFIGSEGGFSEEEISRFREKDAVISRLSKWRLRTATACAAALAVISTELFSSK